MYHDETSTKEYELGFLVAAPEDAEAVRKAFVTRKIELTTDPAPVAMKLSYPVKKHANAYFASWTFSAHPSLVKDLGIELRANPIVLRILLVNAMPKIAPRPARVETVRPAMSEAPVKPSAQPAELTNEALEEQLQAILK